MEQLIDIGLQIAAALLISLIGVLGTWLTLQLSKSAKLQNINTAQKEVIRLAKLTVGELQQTVADAAKAASADGKLSQNEIDSLRDMLLDKTLARLSAPALALLQAAAVDVESLITGTAESWIEQMQSAA